MTNVSTRSRPEDSGGSVEPQPSQHKPKVKIIVTVEEETILLRPSFFFSGDAFSGEEYEPLTMEAEPYYYYCGDIFAGEA